ncbi:MBL fold metallo-hydrolase [Herbiconiux ginsengi]|uniref:MBL fold metallo-hydrolase n=1 Tax=Herbiconiux ginsengi TaxID=381665 RepID=UPI001C31A03F|nr:MBL fold metallo-hydrolase [Herbiconiux ginsengi]
MDYSFWVLRAVDPADVQLVIASHFHYDHIGYLGLFTRAEVVAGRAEYDHWMAKKWAGALEGEFATEADLEASRLLSRRGGSDSSMLPRKSSLVTTTALRPWRFCAADQEELPG